MLSNGRIMAAVLLFASSGCHYYTATTVPTPAANEPFAAGGIFAIGRSRVILVTPSIRVVGSDMPDADLDTVDIVGIGRYRLADVPEGTLIRIDRYGRLDLHGFADCNADGSVLAFATIVGGPLDGRRCYIEPMRLAPAYQEIQLLRPRPAATPSTSPGLSSARPAS